MAKSLTTPRPAAKGGWRFMPVESLPGHIFRTIYAFGERHPRLSVSIKFISVFAIFWLVAWLRNYDPDFGWHLQAGRHFIANGIPAHDIYTYTMPYFEWINHEWLSDILLAKLYDLGGYGVLTVLYAGLWTTALFIAKAHKRWAVVVLAALAMAPYAGVRATTWTVFFLAILMYIVRSPARRARYFIPGLFLVWANMHGGFFIGLAVVGFYYFMEKDWSWLWMLLLAVVATFINPYGPWLYDEVFRTLNDSRVHWQISEWLPAAFLFYRASFIYAALWMSGFIIQQTKFSFKKLLAISPIFLLASFSTNRHYPLFVLVSAADMDGFYQHLKSVLPAKLSGLRKFMLGLAPAVIVIICAMYLAGIGYNFNLHPNREQSFPHAAVAYLRQNPCPGNIFASYNYGGYLIWQLPGVPVYIDGRGPIWRDPEGRRLFDRYNELSLDENAATSAEFQQYNIRCIIWPKTTKGPAMIDDIKEAGWQKVDAGSQGNILLFKAP